MNKKIDTTAHPDTKGYNGGPINSVKNSETIPFGGPRYDPNFKRETTDNSIKPYNVEELTGAYARTNQFKG